MTTAGFCYLVALLCAGSSITLAVLRFVGPAGTYDPYIAVVTAAGGLFGLGHTSVSIAANHFMTPNFEVRFELDAYRRIVLAHSNRLNF